MSRRLLTLAASVVLALLCGYARGPLVIGPGAGVRTTTPSMVRPLREDVTLIPIFTVGDTLAPPDTVSESYVFAPLPDGLGALKTSPAIAEIYVAHELSWWEGTGGARVSRLALDLRNLGILAGDYLVDGTEGYSRFCAASLVGQREGFLSPAFLVNEESVEGFNRGIVAAVDVRDGTVTDLPWLGRFSHEATTIVPVTSGKLVAILTEDFYPGESQLYMYMADNDAALFSGRGRLHVFRADGPSRRGGTRLSSMATRSRPLSGRFVPLSITGSELPTSLEAQAQSVGCLNFVRLEDCAIDRNQPNAFYIADTGSSDFFDPASGRPVTGSGRIYYVRLDPFDPTRVEEMRVLLDGDEGDDLYRPDNLDTDDRYLWIQEDPGGGRGLHPARILRYDLQTQRLEAMAECAERDPQGRMLPQGVGGSWETTGIVNVSEIFGEDTWLIAVQAPNLGTHRIQYRGGSGQLLLMRGPRYPRPEKAQASKPDSTSKADPKGGPEAQPRR